MAPFRNPFGRRPPTVNGTTGLQDENAPPSKLNGDAASERPSYTSSRASSSLSIKKKDEANEYKLSALSSREEKLLVAFPNLVHYVIEPSSPVLPQSTTPRQSLDSRLNNPPRSSIKDMERPQPTNEELFEDVGLDDEAKQQPPKKRGIFARFGDNTESTASGDSSRPSSSHRGFHLPGRKRGQSGQGAELGNISNISRPEAPVTKEPEDVGMMDPTTPSSSVRTRFLIVSDTHGTEFGPEEKPLRHADVAIHCGDLTEESKLEEFRASIRLLEDIRAPLKLVIAGNHDFTMDILAFKKKVAAVNPPLDPELVRKVYGDYGEARQMFEEAEAAGIVFLDEGTHRFNLVNCAALTVYASPWTPSFGDWGFRYPPNEGHKFSVAEEVDVVITHGPPKGIMDYTDDRTRAGCPSLFGAVARARPRLHCFGHIHEGWGAKLVTWRDQLLETPSHFTDIDNDNSIVVEKLSSLRPSKSDTREIQQEKAEKTEQYRLDRCCSTSHCTGDAHPLEHGKQTLFVNAAIEGTVGYPLQLPWEVELELPRAV
ncbi:MAG: hypothetical protein Q9211_003408 [Gyalolechia sp. 1 TL-2023]